MYRRVFPRKNSSAKAVRNMGFKYTSPLLYYETPQDNTELIRNVKESLTSYINAATHNGLAENVSVYLRYPILPDWTVINGEEKYSPASLLKVPLMMVYLNRSEYKPNMLSSKLKYDIEDDNLKTNYKPKEEMEKGKSYTIEDLIRRMIVYSDNTAEDMLAARINEQDFSQVFDDIKINRLNYSHQEDSMDVKTYSYFFRVLYNTTFLSRRISEQALKLLTETTFTNGIVSGVPRNIMVAHKFGERAFQDSGIKQLHDCGIVYFPNNPYILCVMTRGNSFKNLEEVIKNISQTTYNLTKQEKETRN